MPRKNRIDYPGLLHHVIVRGVEKRIIFKNSQDYRKFLKTISIVLESSSSTQIYAWALMPNHFHLLIYIDKTPLKTIMARMLTSYAIYFNKKYDRVGYLFQNRYKSIVCDKDEYFLQLVRYIHLNPLKAGFVRDYKELSTYPYTGHNVILGNVNLPWQNRDEILEYFDENLTKAGQFYERFIIDGIEIIKEQTIETMRFFNNKKIEVKKEEKQDIIQKSMDEIIDEVLKKYNVSSMDLFNGRRNRDVSKARKEIVILLIREGVYSLKNIADKLNVTKAAVNWFLR